MATGAVVRGRRRSQARGGSLSIEAALPRRILGVFLLVVLCYAALAGRLIYLQVLEHEKYRAMASELREKTRVIPARRGLLLDRNGTLLVRNERAADIVMDPNLWYVNTKAGVDTPASRRETAIRNLSVYLPGVDVAAVAPEARAARPEERQRSVTVARKVDGATADRIQGAVKEGRLPGVGIFPTTKRVAMNGVLAAHILGFTRPEGDGLDGLENALNETLAGKPGLLEAEFDVQRRPIPGTIQIERPPVDGRDVVLTLDADLQYEVQEALKKTYQDSQAEAATAVVLDARTSAILAMSTFPSFDINRRGEATPDSFANRAVTSPFEPGSTLKAITVAAALEEKKVSVDSRFYCGGSKRIGRRSISCAHGARHGSEDLTDVIRTSCNVATAECAFRLGKTTLWEYERRFGFGERTGAGLPGESPGMLAHPRAWSDMQLSNIAFGQGIAVTPLQLAAAYAALANDGVWMRPHIVKGTRGGEGTDLREIPREPGRRVVSPQVAQEMRRMLQAVVDDGTGKAAALDGYTAGGKTGTAQIAENGSYRNGKHIGSFVGITPMKDPQFVILVAVTAPRRGTYYGAGVAGPVFKAIAEKALLARRIPRDKGETPSGKRRRGGRD